MQNLSNVLLIGNGTLPGAALLERLARQATFILAADGGADKARAAGIQPDLVIGDLDSLASAPEQVLRVPRQDNTDLEKALDWLTAHRAGRVCIVGSVGGRWDFSIGNFLSVYSYLPALDIYFAGDGWKIYPLVHGTQKTVRPGARVSLIPFTACTRVNLSGTQYPLTNAQLALGHTGRTLSNCAQQAQITVQFESGFMLLYIED